MAIALDTSLWPAAPNVPFDEILSSWIAARFDPRSSVEAVERLIRERSVPPGLVDPGAILRGEMVATDGLLGRWFSSTRDWTWRLGSAALHIPFDAAASVAEIVRFSRTCVDENTLRSRVIELGHDEEIANAVAGSIVPRGGHGRWPSMRRPGLSRREHACLAIRGSAATLILDPQCLSPGWTTDFGRYPSDDNDTPLHTLVTHSHSDHWDIASVVYVSGDVPVIVPNVPHASMLSSDMSKELEIVAQPAVSPSWGARQHVGDMTVHVLPFYGEQPTRDLRLPRGVRNWGNCYRIDLSSISLLVLADSGMDADGAMINVVRDSVAAYGPIDIVVSCCLEFPEAINQGLSHYAFLVPWHELERRFHQDHLPSMTSGPTGLVEICAAAGARIFLPYAHGFSGIGRIPQLDSNGRSEEVDALNTLEQLLRDSRVPTRVVRWMPGEVFDFETERIVRL